MSEFDGFFDTPAPPGAFEAADAFTLKHEGGYTSNDGIGHAANQGIDQNAHPGLDVSKLTSDQTRNIRKTQYWDAIGGDDLAKKDPRLALIAYETAIASGVGTAKGLLASSGDDPAKLLAARVNYMNGLVTRDPAKYGPVAAGWANRNSDLAAAAGFDPKQFGLGASKQPPVVAQGGGAPTAPAAASPDPFAGFVAPPPNWPKPTAPAVPTPGSPAAALPVGGSGFEGRVYAVDPAVKAHQAAVNAPVLASIYPSSDQGVADSLKWNALKEGAHSAVFGMSAPIIGAGAAMQPGAEPGTYDQYDRAATLARREYEAENPWSAAGAQVVGGVPSTALTLGGLGAGLDAARAVGGPIGTAAEFLGGTTGGGLAARTASRAASGALQGVASDYATSAPGEEHPGLSAVGGSIFNTLFGKVGGNLAHAPIDPNVAAAARNYIDETGGTVFGHQLTTDPALAKAGKAAVSAPSQIKQLQEFTGSVAKTFSGDLDMAQTGDGALTPATIASANSRIGGIFNTIASRTTIPDNPALRQGLADVRNVGADIADPTARKTVNYAVNRVISEMQRNGGQIDGDMYQQFTRSNGSLVADLLGDPKTRRAGMALKNTLDNQLEANAPQGLQGTMQAARTQWKNLKIAEDSLDSSTSGLVDPKAYAKAANDAAAQWGPVTRDVQTLARAGDGIKFPKPSDVGGVTGAPPASGLSKLAHSPLGGGLAGAAGGLISEHAGPFMGYVSGSPLLHSPAVAPIAAGALLAGTAAARNALNTRALANPDWARAMLYGGPALNPNLGIPLAVQAGRLPWGQKQ